MHESCVLAIASSPFDAAGAITSACVSVSDGVHVFVSDCVFSEMSFKET